MISDGIAPKAKPQLTRGGEHSGVPSSRQTIFKSLLIYLATDTLKEIVATDRYIW